MNADDTTLASARRRLPPSLRRVIVALSGAIEVKEPDPANDEAVYQRYLEAVNDPLVPLAQSREARRAWEEIPYRRRWRLDGTLARIDEPSRERLQRQAANKLRNAASHLRQTKAGHERAQASFVAAVRTALLTEHDVDAVAEMSGLTADEVRDIRDAIV